MAEAKGLKTPEVMALLRNRFEMPEYALLENVANGVGNGSNGRRRFADALAIEQFGKSGHHLHGFEVKVSRSDWLRELKDNSKADSVYRYCDFWWVVIGDPDLVKDGELPAGWGLLYPRANTLVAKVEPVRQRDVVVHDRAFVAAIFRRAKEQQVDKRLIAEAEHRARTAERQIINDNAEYTERRLQREYDELRKTVKEFEEATGVSLANLSRYMWGTTPGDLGRVVKLVLQGEQQAAHVEADLRRLRQHAEAIVCRIDDALGTRKAEASAA